MMKEVMIPNGSLAVEAQYKEQIIPDYKRNPFIEALPNLLSPQEVIEKIANYPEYDKGERQLESFYRIHMIDRLFQVFQPLPMNLELERKVSRTVRQGYISRNPFDKRMAQDFYREYHKRSENTVNNTDFHSTSLGFTLIGVSGLGKTSSFVRILNLYPQIIIHSEYRNVPFSNYQVVWLKLECPFDASIKGLMYEFFAEIDRLLGTNYYEKVVRTKATIDAMMTVMNQMVRNCSLGLLVIDEIQHLSMAKSGGSEKMLNFFVNLVNQVGVPVVLVGTPKAIPILQGDFRQARRGSGLGGDMMCDRMQKDDVWDLFLNSIWRYQWTKKESPLTYEISAAMYEETQGIPDLVKKVFAIAQAHAIMTGKEEITTQIIRKVAKENLRLVQPMIAALRSNNIREIAKYDDINLGEINFNDTLTRTKESIKFDIKAKEMNRIVNDLAKKNDNLKTESDKKIVRNVGEMRDKNNRNDFDETDIRIIIEQRKNDRNSTYEVLKEAGYIVNFENDIFSKEVAQ